MRIIVYMECSFEGLDNVLQSNEKMNFDVCNFLSEKEQRVLKLHFKGKLTYKEMLEDNLSGLGMVLAHELNGVLVLSDGDIIFFDWESDGTSDHVGIVEKCENEKVYTIEGNSNDDMCRQKEYDIFCRSSKCLWTNSCKKKYNR